MPVWFRRLCGLVCLKLSGHLLVFVVWIHKVIAQQIWQGRIFEVQSYWGKDDCVRRGEKMLQISKEWSHYRLPRVNTFPYLANPISDACSKVTHLGGGRRLNAHPALRHLFLHAPGGLPEPCLPSGQLEHWSVVCERTGSSAGAHPYLGLNFPDISA